MILSRYTDRKSVQQYIVLQCKKLRAPVALTIQWIAITMTAITIIKINNTLLFQDSFDGHKTVWAKARSTMIKVQTTTTNQSKEQHNISQWNNKNTVSSALARFQRLNSMKDLSIRDSIAGRHYSTIYFDGRKQRNS